MSTRGRCLTATVLALALVAAGCGDDDGSSTTPAAAADGGGGGPDGYCALATELNNGDFPTVAQLTAYQEVAPEGIQDQLAIVVPAFTRAIESGDMQSVFADPAVGEAIDAISEFEIETCGPAVAGHGAGTAGTVDPAYADWCAVASRIEEGPRWTEALLTTMETTAPDEIQADIDAVVAEFRKGLAVGDPGLGYVRASYEHIVVVDSFNAEHCGIPQDPGDFQDPAITEPDPEAAQVTVSATEFAYAFAPPTAAGRTTFTMANDGALAHVMVIMQAAPGYTAEEAFASEDDDAAVAYYGSYVAPPGEEAVLTVDLVAGEYMMLCYIPNLDGTPHLAHGMTKAFTVT